MHHPRQLGRAILATITAAVTLMTGGVAHVASANTTPPPTNTVTLVNTKQATLHFAKSKDTTLRVPHDTKITVNVTPAQQAQDVTTLLVTRTSTGNPAAVIKPTRVPVINHAANIHVDHDMTIMPSNETSMNAAALKPVSIANTTTPDLDSYLRQHANPAYTGTPSGHAVLSDAFNVTTTIVDGTKLPHATLNSLNEDANHDNMADHDDAIANQTSAYIALYKIGNGKYYVGRALPTITGATVTDLAVARNNASAQMIHDVIYDKNTGLVYVPAQYSAHEGLALRMQLIVTTDHAVVDAHSRMRVTTTNKRVRGSLINNASATGNLQMVQTDIQLSTVDDDHATIPADAIDSITINGITYHANAHVYSYNERTGVLTVGTAPYGISDLTINLSASFSKSVKRFIHRLADAIIPPAHAAGVFPPPPGSDAALIDGVATFPSTPNVGDSYIVNANTMYKTNGSPGYVDPGISIADRTSGGVEKKVVWEAIGDGGPVVDYNKLMISDIAINRAAQIVSQSVNGVTFPGMTVNLLCSHINLDINFNPNAKPEDTVRGWPVGAWMATKAKIRVQAIRGDELVIGVTVPTVDTQAGAGFFRVRWIVNNGHLQLHKLSAMPNITDNNPAYNLTGAKYGVWKDSALSDPAGVLTVQDNTGFTDTLTLPEGDYWVKEIPGSAAGYGINPNVRQVHVTSGQQEVAALDNDMAEPVGNDPIGILVQKGVTGEAKAGFAPGDVHDLSGIKFRVDYYKGFYDTGDAASSSGMLGASAVFATDNRGLLRFNYSTPVDGTTWPYTSGDYNVMPVGTFVITEVGSHPGLITKAVGQVGQVVYANGAATTVVKQGWPQQPVDNNAVGSYDNDIITGGITITKADATTHTSVAQGDGTLAGVTYEIVNKSLNAVTVNGHAFGKDEVVWTGKTAWDDNSHTNTVSTGNILPYGTYLVRESAPSTGYLNAAWNQTFTIRTQGETHEYTSQDNQWNENTVIRGGVQVKKVDRETRLSAPLGAATLEGTRFDIVNKSAGHVVVNGHDYAPNQVVDTIATKLVNGQYIATTGDHDLPYGTYEIHETGAPTGYLFDHASAAQTHTFTVRQDGQIVDLTQQDAFDNQVQREDWHFKKKDEDSMERMNRVPFLVTSQTTGESHVIVTDENGTWGSSWNAHTQRTNSNDPDSPITNGAIVKDEHGRYVVKDASKLDPDAGTWFTGMSANITTWANDGRSYTVDGHNVTVNDQLRSFPYDTYTVKELPASTNMGHKLVTFTVTLHKYGDPNSAGIDLDYGTIDDKVITLNTKLAYGDHSKVVPATQHATVHDTVNYANLNDGSYVLHGELHLLNQGKDEGVVAHADQPFTVAGSSTGKQTVTFNLDTTRMGGKKLVAFEHVVSDGITLAKHDNLHDEDQTIMVPLIGSTLTGDVDHEANASNPTITLRDDVSYENLEAGKTYTLNGTLMDQATAKPLTDAQGKPVHATAQFTAVASKGSTPVVFTFNHANVAGKTVVAFETLNQGTVALAQHTDIHDAAQTVHLPAVHTTATDKVDGDHEMFAGTQQTLVDTVDVTNLTVGNTYTLDGTLHTHNQSNDGRTVDGGVLKSEDGKPVTAHKEFKATDTHMQVALEFTFDASTLQGATVTAFETLSRNHIPLGVHADITDKSQSVYFPQIATEFADAHGSHEISVTGHDAGKSDGKPTSVIDGAHATLTDTVKYTNLTPHTTYTVHGVLHVRNMDDHGAISDGGVLKDTTGKPVTGATTFTTGDATTGAARVDYTFDATKLTGKTLVAFEQVMNRKELVAEHADIKDEHQTVRVVTIGTTALDTANKTHTITDATSSMQTVSITDTVAYTNLIVGQPHQLSGELHVQAVDKTGHVRDGGALKDANGKPVTATVTFIPSVANGKTNVTFTFPVHAGALDGSSLVAFERVERNGVIVAAHTDITDKSQTVRKLRIGTTLTREDMHSKQAPAAREVKLVDKVAFENLVVGQAYRVEGTLVDAQGRPLVDASGRKFVAQAAFTPDKLTGTVSMRFTVDTSRMLNGAKIVAYERVTTADGKLVAHHENPRDAGQTVTVVKPVQPTAHITLKTGIGSYSYLAAVLMSVMAVLSAAWVVRFRRRHAMVE